MTDPLVVLDRVTKRYPDGTVGIRDASLEINGGEVIGMIGKNGAGKSTLLNMICGLTYPTGGRITFGLDRREIAWCTQLDVIDWSLTVEQNVALPLSVSGQDRQSTRALVEEQLRAVELFDERGKEAENLSGGQIRRTQIARTLAGPAQLLVMDEPASGLDLIGAEYLYGQLRARARTGAAVVISSHDVQGIEPYLDRIIVVDQGAIVYDGDVGGFSRSAGLPELVITVSLDKLGSAPDLTMVDFEVEHDAEEHSLRFTATSYSTAIEQVGRLAAHADVDDLVIERPSLRDAFLASLANKRGPRDPGREVMR